MKDKGILFFAGALGFGLLVIMFAMAFVPALLTNSWGSTLDDGGGDLANVSDIPEELKPIFSAAGKAHKVSPAFVAAIYWKEHGKSFPIMGPWASSPKGANGPFQFIERTWEGWSSPYGRNGVFETDPAIINKYGGYGQDGDKDAKADVQNLWDSGFAASDLLGSNGAAPYVTDIEKLKDVAARYNCGRTWDECKGIPETADYVPDVISAYQKFILQM